MHKFIITVAVATFLPLTSYAGNNSQDDKCKALSDKLVKYMKANKIVDYSIVTPDSFYSNKLKTCIHTEVADFGEMYKIRDLSKKLIKDGPDYFNTLFYCDSNGANSAKLDILKKHNGNVYSLSFREWQDDGFGGLPANLKKPEKSYSKETCQKLYTDWIKKIK